MRRLMILIIFAIALMCVAIPAIYIIRNDITRPGKPVVKEELTTMVRLENQYISLAFDKSKGNIVSLFDKRKQIEFINNDKADDSFRLDWHSSIEGKFKIFEYQKDDRFTDGVGYILRWTIDPQVQVIGSIQLPNDKDEAHFYSEVINKSDERIMAVEYPIIGNLTSITSDGEKDYLAHSFATGFKIHNPIRNFKLNEDGLRFMPYPEGFSGSTMQFFTYYGESKGGLYFSTYDPDFYPKWLNFYKNGNDLLEASFMHGNEDVVPGKGMKVSYPVVVKTLQEGSWYEAADIYKQWAIGQKWCSMGELSERGDSDKAKWLLEDIGLSTFGINGMYDRSIWIKTYHDLIKTNIFHVLGPDWPKKDQTYYKGVPGGFDDWFPARFSKENLNAIKQVGDKYAPFEFDYLIDTNGADSAKIKESLQLMPLDIRSMDKYNFTLLCPLADYTRDLHVKRDEYLEDKYKVDSIYYDISANNILKACFDPRHGHSAGAGKEITDAYRANYISTKNAMINAAGRYIPIGTEMVNEVFLDILDYYQARAGAQPATAFEGYNIRPMLKSGEAELIPMFTYVYHEYGPVRLDGWGKLTEEIGDLFYYTVARTYLWGGLYELNYEYSPMEVINGRENSPDEHYYLFDPIGFKLAPERGEYITQFARLRTGKGNKYLAYGRMLKPMDIKSTDIKLNYYNYTVPKSGSEYNDRGEVSVNSIVHSAWEYQNKSIGLFFANMNEEKQTVKFQLDMQEFNIKGDQFLVMSVSGDLEQKLFKIGGKDKKDVAISIPAGEVVMLEIISQ